MYRSIGWDVDPTRLQGVQKTLRIDVKFLPLLSVITMGAGEGRSLLNCPKRCVLPVHTSSDKWPDALDILSHIPDGVSGCSSVIMTIALPSVAVHLAVSLFVPGSSVFLGETTQFCLNRLHI